MEFLMPSPDLNLLSRDEVERRTRLCESSMYAMIKAGTFPRPLKIGHGSVDCVAWVEADINQWLEDLQAA